MASERTDAAGYLGWFLFGAAVGAVAAFLTTPRTGREARELLVERGGEVAKRAQEVADEAQRRAQAMATDAQGRASEWLDKSREMLEEQTQRLVTAFEAGREAMRDEIKKWSTTAAPRG
ncbi:MAG: YtxH domain-containing protein [Candidatus Rokubacteria bacterium]|nr:YtxH domain-containing protein [Candidatus Rokubacteria bacterium]MBI3824675.1 YtxH domain-containing protein [Candidatus Rokubacteria bacterium]